jgi:AcrR family transcriptional regulator
LGLRIPQQQRSRERRDSFLRAALHLFAEHGYAAVTTDMIAAKAEAAVGSFYVYFKSKSDVLLVLMDRLLLEVEALNFDVPSEALAGVDVRVLLGMFVRRALQADLEYAGVYRAWREAIVLEAAIAAWDAPIRIWTAGRIAGVFAVAATLPGARTDLDRALTAELVNRLFWDLLTDPGALAESRFEPVTEALTVTLYHILFQG